MLHNGKTTFYSSQMEYIATEYSNDNIPYRETTLNRLNAMKIIVYI